MKIIRNIVLGLALGLVVLSSAPRAQALTNQAYYLGVGLFSENSINKMTATATGEKSTLGTFTIPLIVKYDWNFAGDFFIAPTFTYTPLGRDDAGGSATVTLAHLMIPVGRNLSFAGLDWYVGPGILYRFEKGNGGLEVLSNGSGSATFARPGRSVTLANYTLNAGTSFIYGTNSRFAFDLVTEGTFSSKRTYNLMFSYCYMFAGGR